MTAGPASRGGQVELVRLEFRNFLERQGIAIGRNIQRPRHQEFIRFLNAIEAVVPAGKLVHVILDNYAAYKHPKVRQCSSPVRYFGWRGALQRHRAGEGHGNQSDR